MGKKLLLFGEDYSTNGINSCYVSYNGLSVTTKDGGYLIQKDPSESNRALIVADNSYRPIKVPVNHHIIINGLLGKNGDKTLWLDYVAYNNEEIIPFNRTGQTGINPNVAFTGSNYVGTRFFPFNQFLPRPESSIIITNNTENDLYYAFGLKLSDNSIINLDGFELSVNVLPNN